MMMTSRFSLLACFGLAQCHGFTDVQPTLKSENGKLELTLTIGEALYRNLDTGLVQTLVGFNGIVGGPTLYVKPGDELTVTLINKLPKEPCDTNVPELFSQYHGVDITNLHFHGLHTPHHYNPIQLKVRPGENYTYSFSIPVYHMGGTHWYHPHSLGSVSLQSGGGALGMLIVEDLEGDLPQEIYNLPALDLRVQFLNMTYLQYDYATGTAGSYVPLCQQFCLPVENRANCSEHFFENGPLEGAYNTTISPDGLEYETTLVNGVEQPTFDLIQNQWYRIRILYVPTRFRTMEPAFPECEVKLLAKDGIYMLETPRDIDSGFMTSGSRADFLVRCVQVGVQEFRSLSLARNSSNWIGSQKRNSLDRVLAYLNVQRASHDINISMAKAYSNPDKIIPFAPARPCYIPDMINVKPDMTNFLLMSGLVPAPPLSDPLPIDRPACCVNTSYYDVNGLGTFNIAHRDEYPADVVADREFDFELEAGSIWDVDIYTSQIHPAHWHVNSYQLVELPVLGDTHTGYFQVGDFHDTLLLTIADSIDYYGKAKLRFSIADWTGPMLGHCHTYRHSDRGMAYLGNIRGKEGMVSPKVIGTCYTTFKTRGGFVYVGPNDAPFSPPSAVGDTTASPSEMMDDEDTDVATVAGSSRIYHMKNISILVLSLVLFAAIVTIVVFQIQHPTVMVGRIDDPSGYITVLTAGVHATVPTSDIIEIH